MLICFYEPVEPIEPIEPIRRTSHTKAMIRLRLPTLLFCALNVLGPITASAVALSGEISLDGAYTVDIPNYSAGRATKFSGFSEVLVSDGPTGDYAGTAGISVFHSAFTFDPFIGPIIPLWTFTDGPTSYSFDLTSVTIDFRVKKAIVLSGTGIAHITGFDDTGGDWIFSANTAGTTFSFSSSNSVPEGGATLPLLGLAVVGLGLFGRVSLVAIRARLYRGDRSLPSHSIGQRRTQPSIQGKLRIK